MMPSLTASINRLHSGMKCRSPLCAARYFECAAISSKEIILAIQASALVSTYSAKPPPKQHQQQFIVETIGRDLVAECRANVGRSVGEAGNLGVSSSTLTVIDYHVETVRV